MRIKRLMLVATMIFAFAFLARYWHNVRGRDAADKAVTKQ